MNSELKELLNKYVNNRITFEERRRLQVLGQAAENCEILADIIAEILAQEDVTAVKSPLNKMQVFEGILQEASKREVQGASIGLERVQPAPDSIHRIKPGLRRWYKTAAVWLFGLIGLIYCWRFYMEKKHTNVVATTLSAESKKSEKNTVLTFADGKTVILDVAKNGALLKHGNAKVVKLDKDQLMFQFAGNTPANKSEGNNTIQTPRGGRYQVTLSDGTSVWLNAMSTLKFPSVFTGDHREVTLEGEAYFEVAKNKKMPFIVHANNTQITVLGTHFNVMAYANEDALKTTLLEGSVKVSHGGSSALIKPGQQASLEKDKAIFKISDADLESVMAWKEGRFVFSKTNIKEIMQQVARWYDVDIRYEGDVTNVNLSGNMTRKDDYTQILELLERTGSVRFKTQGNQIIVMPN